MKKCPLCGKKLSDGVVACPKKECSFRLPRPNDRSRDEEYVKKWVFNWWILIVLFVLFLRVGAGSGGWVHPGMVLLGVVMFLFSFGFREKGVVRPRKKRGGQKPASKTLLGTISGRLKSLVSGKHRDRKIP